MQRLFRGPGLALLAIVTYFATVYGVFDDALDDYGHGWLLLVMALGFGVPYLVLEMAYPRYFYSVISGDDVDYEFSSRRYAQWFQGLNGGRIHAR